MSHAGHNSELDCTCTDCKLRYPKFYHPHTWRDLRKLDSKKLIGDREYYRDAQEELCKKYNIFLPLYRTKKERRWDYLEHVFNLIKKGIKGFGKKLDEQHAKNKRKSKFKWSDFTMSEKSYAGLTGKSTSKDLDFITGRGKKADMSFITGRTRQKNLSYITGKSKRNNSNFITARSKGKDMSYLTGGKKDYSALIGKRKKIKL
jgi:hypothetical protein